MAVRTISRDATNSRVVLVWAKDVMVDDVGSNGDGAHYASLDDVNVVPTQINADTFKAAFGFLPLTGTVCRYIIRKARAPESAEAKLTTAIKALVKDVLDDE